MVFNYKWGLHGYNHLENEFIYSAKFELVLPNKTYREETRVVTDPNKARNMISRRAINLLNNMNIGGSLELWYLKGNKGKEKYYDTIFSHKN